MRRWLASALLLSALGAGSDAPAQSGSTTLSAGRLSISSMTTFTPSRYFILTRHDGKMVAQFDLEKGVVEFGPGLPADEGARETWRALAAQAPEFHKAVREAKDDACWRRLLSEP